MERFEEVNTRLRDWLTRTFPSGSGTFRKAGDEL